MRIAKVTRLSSKTRTITTSAMPLAAKIGTQSNKLDWKKVFAAGQPMFLRNYASDWPAIKTGNRQWSNLQHLCNSGSGKVSVRVEIGKNYLDSHIKVLNMPLEEFIHCLSLPPSTDQGRIFLAQQDMSDLPDLQADCIIPEMCLQTGYGQVYKQNLWLCGAAGSVSPCHYDPYHNILVQVIGSKKIVLFDPKYSDYLYPALGTLQKNTSLVDIDNPDYNRFPLARQLQGYEVVLQVGDAVYIPKKWWHYCRADDISCSVNFWWV